MSARARIYFESVVGTGLFVIASAMAEFAPTDMRRFFAYLALAAFGASLQIRIACIPVTLSPSFAFILVGIADFSLGEAMLLAMFSTLFQCWWRPRSRRSRNKTLFNIAAVSIAVMAAYNPSHHWMSQNTLLPRITLCLAALTYFAANTGLVAGMVALIENLSFLAVWRYLARHLIAYYALGGLVASIIVAVNRLADWRAGLLVTPILYLVYHAYKVHLRKKGLLVT